MRVTRVYIFRERNGVTQCADLVIVSRGRLIEKFALRKPVLEFQIIYWACKPLNKT